MSGRPRSGRHIWASGVLASEHGAVTLQPFSGSDVHSAQGFNKWQASWSLINSCCVPVKSPRFPLFLVVLGGPSPVSSNDVRFPKTKKAVIRAIIESFLDILSVCFDAESSTTHRSVYPISFYLLHGVHLRMTTLTVYMHLATFVY